MEQSFTFFMSRAVLYYVYGTAIITSIKLNGGEWRE